MRARQARRVLHAGALADLGVAAFLLLGSWDGLFDVLGVPSPEPAIFAELAAALFVGFAYLLWVAPGYAALARRVAEAAALTNGLGAALIALWLASRPDGLELLGGVLLGAVALGLAVMAWLQARIVGF